MSRFQRPPAVRAEPEGAPANALGMRRIMFMVDDVDDVVARLRSRGAEPVGEIAQYKTSTGSASCVAPRASSSGCPSGSAETRIASEGGRVRLPELDAVAFRILEPGEAAVRVRLEIELDGDAIGL